jgi:hypothetical protein
MSEEINRQDSSVEQGVCCGDCGDEAQFTCYICLKDEVDPPIRYCGKASCKDAWRNHKMSHKPVGRVQDSVDSLEAQKEAESRQVALGQVLAKKAQIIRQTRETYLNETIAHVERHHRDEATILEHLETQKSQKAQIINLTELTETLQSDIELSRLESEYLSSKVVDLETEASYLASNFTASMGALTSTGEQFDMLEASAAAAAATAAAEVIYTFFLSLFALR